MWESAAAAVTVAVFVVGRLNNGVGKVPVVPIRLVGVQGLSLLLLSSGSSLLEVCFSCCCWVSRLAAV